MHYHRYTKQQIFQRRTALVFIKSLLQYYYDLCLYVLHNVRIVIVHNAVVNDLKSYIFFRNCRTD